MIHVDKNGVGYFKGDKVKLTGNLDSETYSITFWELVLLEGRFKGEMIWNTITTV